MDGEGKPACTGREQEAASVAPGANGLLFLPYLSGKRSPYWNPQAPAPP